LFFVTELFYGEFKIYSVKRVITFVVVALVVLSLSFGVILYERSSQKSAKELGPELVLSVAPVSAGPSTTSERFLYASVQIYVNPSPTVSTGLQSYANVTPLFNGSTNSTGDLVASLSYGFYAIADNWTSYFMHTGNLGAMASYIAEVSYYYSENNTTMVYYQSVVVPFDPAFYVLPTGNFQNVTEIYGYHHASNLTFQDHPSFSSMKGYIYASSIQSPSIVGTNDLPLGIGGGNGSNFWSLIKSTSFSNETIPLAWANNSVLSSNNEEIDISVFLGSGSQEALFHLGQISSISGSVSYSVLSNSSYTSPENANGTWIDGLAAYNALPLNENSPHAVMLYVVGTITLDQFREYIYTSGGYQPSNNYHYTTEISSLNVNGNRNYDMDHMDITSGTTWSLMEPHNLAKYLFSSSYISTENYTLSNGGTADWSTIEDSMTSASSNLWPEINSLFGLALSVVGVIAGADGWAPSAGWADLASEIATYAGVASSVYGLLNTQVTGVSDSVYLIAGSVNLENPVGSSNSLVLNALVNNVPMTINGRSGQFNIAVYDLEAVST
jgi:hypothetical protein